MNKFKTFLIAFISFILQVSVFSKVDIFGANINIIVAFVICLSLTLGSKSASYTGLVIGLLEDLMFSKIIGVRALSYFLIGHVVGDEKFRNFLFVSLITYIFNGDIVVIKNYLFVPILVEALLNTLMYLIYHIIIKKLMYIPTYRI